LKEQILHRHLQFLIAAEKCGSFRRAAEELGVKPSSLSRGIQDMEKMLGISIFERSSSGVRLTNVGAEILRTSRFVVEALAHMTATAKNSAAGGAGRLTIGFYTSFSAGNLRSCLIGFQERFPDIELNMVEGPRERLYSGIRNGQVDIAIVTGETGSSPGKSMGLWSERIMVALPDKHRLAENSIVYWTDMREETFLFSIRDPGPEIQDIVLAKIPSAGKRPKLINYDIDCERIKCAVGAGFGLSLTCEAGAAARFPGVVYREARDGHGPSQISYSAHWNEDNPNPALKQFIALLEERHPRLPGEI
jgi:DNA-binding transcriptional LysR family regulator